MLSNPAARDLVTLDPVGEGHRLRHQSLVALTLAGVVPVLVLTYVAYQYVLPNLYMSDGPELLALESLLTFTALSMIAGGYTISRTGRMVGRIGEMMGGAHVVLEIGRKSDTVDTLTASLGVMLEKIEEQAKEVSTLATRLDAVNRELERKNSELSALSFRDGLTGLYNRRHFSLRVEEEIARSHRFPAALAVVLIDLDGFKAVNDEFGHPAGDAMLRMFAEVVAQCSREMDVVARFGGDEFAVLLVETDEAGARQYAERVRRAVEADDRFPQERRITASFGVAARSGDDDVNAADDLLASADEALYRAKRAGKNRVAAAGAGVLVDADGEARETLAARCDIVESLCRASVTSTTS